MVAKIFRHTLTLPASDRNTLSYQQAWYFLVAICMMLYIEGVLVPRVWTPYDAWFSGCFSRSANRISAHSFFDNIISGLRVGFVFPLQLTLKPIRCPARSFHSPRLRIWPSQRRRLTKSTRRLPKAPERAAIAMKYLGGERETQAQYSKGAEEGSERARQTAVNRGTREGCQWWKRCA